MNLKITTSFLCASLLMTSLYASQDTDIVDEINVNKAKSITEIKIDNSKELKAVNYQIKTHLSDEIPSLPIYKVAPINVKKNDDIEKISDIFKFSIEKDKIYTNSNNSLSRMVTDSKGRTIEYFDSGAVFFSKKTMISEKSEDILKLNKLDKKSAKDYYSLTLR